MLPRFIALILLSLLGISLVHAQTLRIVTVNVWSGLDYRGRIQMGEYEPDSTRQHRFRLLVRELKEHAPDVVALQESNPVGRFASALADELNFDYVRQRTNGGIKFGTIGLPVNLNEGLVILAKKGLKLKLIDVWDLSRSFGIFGNVLSFHFKDQNIALAASIEAGGNRIIIINTHLSSTVPDDSLTRSKLLSLPPVRAAHAENREEYLRAFGEEAQQRSSETAVLIDHLRTLGDTPVILLGDFNAVPESHEIQMLVRQARMRDAAAVRGFNLPTWDPERNSNIRFSLQPSDDDDPLEFGGPLGAWYDSLSRRIDYVFLSSAFASTDVVSVQRLFDRPWNGIYASDHYGVMAEISLSSIGTGSGSEETNGVDPQIEFLPILMYDTDVGFGYGAKSFFLNQFGKSESFDVTAFNSTKGERWYRLVFSVPDFELRQGKPYSLSFDLIMDYDKYLKNNFFGVGNNSQEANREVYTKEPLEIQAAVSRGFSEKLVGQIGLKFRMVRTFNYEASKLFATTLSHVNHGKSDGFTFFTSFRYDSRNSYVNPSDGDVVQLDLEAGSSGLAGDYTLKSIALSTQTYHILFYPKTVFAARLMGQAVGGSNLPIHVYASLGGNRTLRGYPQDRFVDRIALLSNAEVRFPLVWRFNGVLFADAGKVWGNIGQTSILSRGWKTNLGFGLRFIMDTFVVRADLGMSREGSGFYFNFGYPF